MCSAPVTNGIFMALWILVFPTYLCATITILTILLWSGFILCLPRNEAVACFRLFTGHEYLQAHLYRIGDSPSCKLFELGDTMYGDHLNVCEARFMNHALPNEANLIGLHEAKWWKINYNMDGIVKKTSLNRNDYYFSYALEISEHATLSVGIEWNSFNSPPIAVNWGEVSWLALHSVSVERAFIV